MNCPLCNKKMAKANSVDGVCRNDDCDGSGYYVDPVYTKYIRRKLKAEYVRGLFAGAKWHKKEGKDAI